MFAAALFLLTQNLNAQQQGISKMWYIKQRNVVLAVKSVFTKYNIDKEIFTI